MEQQNPKRDYFHSNHFIILGCYTVFAILLIAESLLLKWEMWALILIALSVVLCWVIHIRRPIPGYARVWIYAFLMMMSTFFYGTHVSSTFDLGLLMTVLILIFISTGIPGLITLCQCTYYLAMLYDLITMYLEGEKFDSLIITRILLHFIIMTVICFLARKIISQWVSIMDKSEEEKQAMQETTERLNDFLANISHEIRTPVNAVIGLSRICADKVEGEDVKKDLLSVMEAGQKIGDQIGDILDYSEIDMNSLAVNEEDYMITSLLHDVIAEITPLKRPDLELVIDVDPHIPSTMRSDVTKLKKIFRHLIDNALKYTEEGGVYVHITPEERDYGINLLLEVTDTGIGMSRAELEMVFERFYQADSGKTRSANGLGLGLSIANGFIRSLNGFLTIESEPKNGTTVRVSIPQMVVGTDYCMSIRSPERLCLGAFLRFEKFENPHVREFYNAMVKDLVLGLGVKMQRVNNMDDFKQLAKTSSFTHVFIGKQEYLENQEFMNSLAEKAMVAVICDDAFRIPDGSEIHLMRKPFYCVPVISFVNTDKSEQGKTKGKLFARGVRTLVVDDERMNLLVARQIFSGYGMEVDTVFSGPEAIEYVRKHDTDLIFMDHMMPGMDGVEAMKRIRAIFGKDKKDVPVVALTANAVSTANEMFLREGFDAFLAKPIVITELERVLKKVLPKSRLTVEVPAADKKASSAALRREEFTGPEGSKSAAAGSGDTTAGSKGAAAGFGKGTSEPPEKTDSKKSTENTEKASGITGTFGTVTSPDDRMGALKALGIDTKSGLLYCQNDMEFYQELLLQYAGEAAGKMKAANRNFKDGDLKNYEILVHALKSTSKMIGAAELSEAAYKLEKAAKDGDEETIRNGHDSAMTEYKRLADGILKIFGKQSEAAESKAGDEDEIAEFSPETETDDDILEFLPEAESDDDILEFLPETESDDDILEFLPETEPDDDILEFAPETGTDDDILEFAPETEMDDGILEFAPETESDDDVIEFYPEGGEQP